MKIVNIVLEEQKDGMRLLLFNEKDESNLTTKKEQEWADQIETVFKEFTEILKSIEKKEY
jgi:hypothetical protein